MRRASGATLTELLVVVALMGIAAMITALNLRPAEAPLQTATRLTEGFILQARSSAIATTSAYRVVPDGPAALALEHAGACDDTVWTEEPDSRLGLPRDVTLADTAWSVCFTRRGLSASNVTVTLVHPDSGTSQLEVLLGGTTRVIP